MKLPWWMKALISIITAVSRPYRWYDDRKRSVDSVGISGGAHNVKKAVAYCENDSCGQFSKGTFLMNHGSTWRCTECNRLGLVKQEKGEIQGYSRIFRETMVRYNYSYVTDEYLGTVIVRDDDLSIEHSVYTLESPLIRTEKRALKVAEAILANLNYLPDSLNGDNIPRYSETLFSFDEPIEELKNKLNGWSSTINGHSKKLEETKGR